MPGKVLVDAARCAEAPSASALDAAWTFLGGEEVLECDAVLARLSACAQADELSEAVLFSEWRAALCGLEASRSGVAAVAGSPRG